MFSYSELLVTGSAGIFACKLGLHAQCMVRARRRSMQAGMPALPAFRLLLIASGYNSDNAHDDERHIVVLLCSCGEFVGGINEALDNLCGAKAVVSLRRFYQFFFAPFLFR